MLLLIASLHWAKNLTESATKVLPGS